MSDKRVERTRAALLAAVAGLAAERDVAHVSIRDIVARAGVGYATFFRHFRDKQELLLALADALTDAALPAILDALSRDDTRQAALALCAHVDANRGASRALMSAGVEPTLRRAFAERAVTRGMALDLPAPPELPPDLAVSHGVHAILGLISWWLDHGTHIGVAEMAGIVDRLVLTPVRKGATTA